MSYIRNHDSPENLAYEGNRLRNMYQKIMTN